MSNYWSKRIAKAQDRLTSKNTKKVEKQLTKYYVSAMESVIKEFEATYDKLKATMEAGKEPVPADLYKLDKYWKLQGQMRHELEKLGNRQAVLMSKAFETNYFEVYYSFALPGKEPFTTLDTAAAKQMINSIWCADGKSWSSRIWGNIQRLQDTLNDKLIECVVSGKKTTELKRILQEQFGASYSRADTLVRTEMAHIQTEAAKKRYQDYGLEEYEILGNEDDSCGQHGINCHELHGKKFKYSEMRAGVNAPPFHPNCKCSIIPVIK